MSSEEAPGKVMVNSTNTGLYSGNCVIEFNTDQKVVKPVIKVNEKTKMRDVFHAVRMAKLALILSKKVLEDTEGAVIPDAITNISTKGLKNYDLFSEIDELYNDNDDDEIIDRPRSLDGHR